MKINIRVFLSWLIFSAIMLFSCSQQNGDTTNSPALASEDQYQTFNYTTANTVLPPPTAMATNSIDDARKRLLELLRNNGGCRLPCLWGVSPEKSSYQEAQEVFAQFDRISELVSFLPEGGVVFPNYSEKDFTLAVVAGFNAESPQGTHQIVDKISFQARIVKRTNNEIVDEFGSTPLNKYIDFYMLPFILTEYGNPDTVMLSTIAKLPSSGVPGGFKVLLLYPDQGILVNYTMQMQISGENIMGCPTNAHVELELYPPGRADSFFDLLEPSGWTQIIQKTYKLLDRVTSMTQTDFYQIFSQPTDKCILTPANLWPIPD